MAARLDPDAVRAYLARDWARAHEAKRAYWHARVVRGGLPEALAVSDQLRAWQLRMTPESERERDREEDLETHRRVAQALLCTAPAPAPHIAPAPRAKRPRARRARAR
jgi:hypothetical protein